MPKRKRQAKKNLEKRGRLKDAFRWLESGGCSRKPLVETYSKRYVVSKQTAWHELVELGHYDELCIQSYEAEGIEWEFKVEPLSGDMLVVPKGTEEHEIYEIHGLT